MSNIDLVRRCLAELCGVDRVMSGAVDRKVGALALQAAIVEVQRDCLMRHPLGFWRIPLTEWLPNEPRIAVHVWQNETIAEESDIHDHCYDFSSICLNGYIEHEIFTETSEAVGRLFPVGSYKAGSCENSVGDVDDSRGLIRLRSLDIRSGDICSLTAKTFHATAIKQASTVTVQFQSPYVKREARVYKRSSTPETRQVDAEAKACITSILSQLSDKW